MRPPHAPTAWERGGTRSSENTWRQGRTERRQRNSEVGSARSPEGPLWLYRPQASTLVKTAGWQTSMNRRVSASRIAIRARYSLSCRRPLGAAVRSDRVGRRVLKSSCPAGAAPGTRLVHGLPRGLARLVFVTPASIAGQRVRWQTPRIAYPPR